MRNRTCRKDVSGKGLSLCGIRSLFGFALCCVLFALFAAPAAAQSRFPGGIWREKDHYLDNQEMVEYIRSHDLPDFREGHRLRPLSVSTPLPMHANKELTENWGYAIMLGMHPDVIKQLDDPESPTRKLLALASSDPKRYPLSVGMMPNRCFGRLAPGFAGGDDPWYVYLKEFLKEYMEDFS